MKLVKPYFEILEQESGISGIHEAIERAYRLLYKPMPPYESEEHFIDGLINAGCLSCFEHGTVYIKVNEHEWADNFYLLENSPNTICIRNRYESNFVYITSNYREVYEFGLHDKISRYIINPSNYHHKRVSVFLSSDIETMEKLFKATKSELEKQDPQILEIMNPLYAEFIKRKLIGKIE